MFDLKVWTGLRKQVADTREHAAQLRASIEKLKRERDDLISAPAAKSDLKAALQKYLAEEQSDFRIYLAGKLAPLIRAPHKLENGELVARHFSAFGAPVPDDSLPSHETMSCSLLGLLGQAALPAYLAAIDALDYVGGPPIAERAGKVKKLSTEIDALEKQLHDLVETARGAGVDLEVYV